MAAVTMCDVCNNVCKNDEAKFVKVFNCNKSGDTTCTLLCLDVCPECYNRLKKLLKVSDK